MVRPPRAWRWAEARLACKPAEAGKRRNHAFRGAETYYAADSGSARAIAATWPARTADGSTRGCSECWRAARRPRGGAASTLLVAGATIGRGQAPTGVHASRRASPARRGVTCWRGPRRGLRVPVRFLKCARGAQLQNAARIPRFQKLMAPRMSHSSTARDRSARTEPGLRALSSQGITSAALRAVLQPDSTPIHGAWQRDWRRASARAAST